MDHRVRFFQPGYSHPFFVSFCCHDLCSHRDLTIVCRIDLNDSGDGGVGGFIPMWLYVKTIGYTAAESVYKMRRALIKEHKARLQQQTTGDKEASDC